MKKLVVTVIASVLFLSLLIFAAPEVARAYDAPFAGGEGTDISPYQIETYEQLYAVRDYLDAHFVLLNDIDLTAATSEGGAYYNDGAGWTPIGSNTAPFTGAFDGGGNKVTGLYINIVSDTADIYAGLFGYIDGGSVQGLSVEGCDIRVSGANSHFKLAGGITACILSGTITNCNTDGSVSSAGGSPCLAGGIAGNVTDSVIDGCNNSADVTSETKAGGIVGDCNGTINNSSNTGYIRGNSPGCYNYTGGIAGQLVGSASNCHNTGDVSGRCTDPSQTESSVGGITGWAASGTYSNCYNTGSVSNRSAALPGSHTGGIAGYSRDIQISDCYNTGSVSADSDHSDVGGITGTMEQTSSIIRCYNKGSISSVSKAGGIAGQISGSISYCYNWGSVRNSSIGYVGGIAALATGTVECCYNAGTISSSSPYCYSGGISGEASSAVVRNCYNTGHISMSGTGTIYAGGISGYVSSLSQLRYCYNAGVIECSVSNGMGGIAGRLYSGTISGCYYLDRINKGVGNGTDNTTAITIAYMKQQETFEAYDFVAIWTMDGNVTYACPELKDMPMAGTYVTSVAVNSESDTVVKTETLQMSAGILPADADNGSVTWSVTNGTGEASINEDGLLTAAKAGTVTVTATANDGGGIEGIAGVSGSKDITVEPLPAASIEVTSDSDRVAKDGTMQMSAEVLPAQADNKIVTWSVENGTGEATITESGLLTGINTGTVTVKATAADGSSVTGEKTITVVLVHNVVYHANGAASGDVPADSIKYKSGDNVKILGNTGNLIRDGYTFSCWNTQEDGKGVDYAADANYTMGDTDQHLYAKWSLVTYTITYNLDMGTADPQHPNPETYNIETPTFMLGYPIRPGYAFSGWTYEGRTSPNKYVTINKGTFGNKSFTANWTASSGSASLSDIEATNGILYRTGYIDYPGFADNCDNYTLLLDNGKMYSDITLSLTNPGAVIKINGTPGTSIRLGARPGGLKEANIVVTYGEYLHSYTVKLETRSSNANLRSISGGELLTPYFDPDVLKYSLSTELNSNMVGIGAFTDDPYATIKTSSTHVALGSTIYPEKATIEVTAPDGVTKKTYTVTVTNKRNNAYIERMWGVSGVADIVPSSPDTKNYYVVLIGDLGSVGFDVYDDACRVWINGESTTNLSFRIGIGYYNYPEKVNIKIKAPDGAIRTYTVKIYNSSVKLSMPSLKTKTVDCNSVQLSWSKITGADGYEIYRAEPGKDYALIKEVRKITDYTDKCLYPGVKYSYKIRAKWFISGDWYYSSYSSVRSAQTASKLVLKAAPLTYTSNILSWNKEAGATGYEVWWCDTSRGTYSYLTDVTDTSYTHKGLTTGKTYYYKVIYFDKSSGTKQYGQFSDYKSAKPAWPKITLKAASQTYTSIILSWNEIAGASGYEVWKYDKALRKYAVLRDVKGVTSLLDTGLSTGTNYNYKVVPYDDASGNKTYGHYSSVKSAKPAWPKITLTAASQSYNSIILNWNTVSAAEGYEVWRCLSAKGTYTYLSDAPENSFTDKGLAAGTTYYYKVKAYDVVDGKRIYSPLSGYKYAKPVPGVPSGLDLGAGTDILVRWNTVEGAAGYEVYRARSYSSNYEKIGTASGLSFWDKDARSGSTYYYKVRAYCITASGKYIYGGFSQIKGIYKS